MTLRTWSYEHGPKSLTSWLDQPISIWCPFDAEKCQALHTELQPRGRLPPASDVCLEHLPDDRKIQTYAAWFADLGPLETLRMDIFDMAVDHEHGQLRKHVFLHNSTFITIKWKVLRCLEVFWCFLSKPCWPTQPSIDSRTGPIVPEVQYSHQDKVERWCCAARISRQRLFSKVLGRAEERRDFGCWPTCKYGLQHMTHQT